MNNAKVIGTGFVFNPQLIAPTGLVRGAFYYDSVSDTLKYFEGNNTQTIQKGGITSIATSAVEDVLMKNSARYRIYTGTLSQIVKLPSTATLHLGDLFDIVNKSTMDVTVQDSAGLLIAVVPANGRIQFRVTNLMTEGWDFQQVGGDGANRNLSNLLPTSINQNLIPDGIKELGAALSPWNRAFLSTIFANDISATELRSNILVMGSDKSVGVEVRNLYPAGDGVNASLNWTNIGNLSAVSINPFVTDTHSLGTNLLRWSNLFATNLRTSSVQSFAIDSMLSIGTPAGTSMTPANVSISTGNNAEMDAPTGDINIATGLTSGTGIRGKVLLDGSVIDVSAKNIVNAADPINPQDVATKAYVDANGGGAQGSVLVGPGGVDAANAVQIPMAKNYIVLAPSADYQFYRLPETQDGDVIQIQEGTGRFINIVGPTLAMGAVYLVYDPEQNGDPQTFLLDSDVLFELDPSGSYLITDGSAYALAAGAPMGSKAYSVVKLKQRANFNDNVFIGGPALTPTLIGDDFIRISTKIDLSPGSPTDNVFEIAGEAALEVVKLITYTNVSAVDDAILQVAMGGSIIEKGMTVANITLAPQEVVLIQHTGSINISIVSRTLDMAAGGAFANQMLSNLIAPTAINQSLLPASPGINLGSILSPWTVTYSRSALLFTEAGGLQFLKPITFDSAGSLNSSTLNQNLNPDGTFSLLALSVSNGSAAVQSFMGSGIGIYSTNDAGGSLVGTKGIFIGSGNKTGGAGTTGNIKLRTGLSTVGDSGAVTIETGSVTTGIRGKIFLDALAIDVTNKNVVNVADPINPQDAATKAYVDMVAGGGGGGASVVSIQSFDFSFTDFNTVMGPSSTVTLVNLPAATKIKSVVLKNNTAFVDSVNPMNVYEVSVGIAGDLSKYALAFNASLPAGPLNFQNNGLDFIENIAAPTPIQLTLSNVGLVDLTNLTAGSFSVAVEFVGPYFPI